jgi:hypothetical protein
MDSYHLLNHNCNNFTDEACRWLVGQPIPAHITGLPAEVLNTPLGKMVEPMINQMMTAKNGMIAPINGNAQEMDDSGSHLDHDDVFPGLGRISQAHELDSKS